MPLLGTAVAMVVAVTCRRAASFTAASGGGSSRSGIGGSSFVAALESMRYPSAFSKSCYSGFGDGRVSSRGRRGIALSEFVSRGWGAMIGRTLEASGRRTRGKSSSLALLSGVERIDKKKIRSGGGTFFSSSAVLSGGSSMPSPSVVEAKRSPGMTANINKSSVELPSNESSEKLVRIRHSCAHVMAMAVQRLFPAIQVTIGPWIKDGFYYDFHCPDKNMVLSEIDLKEIKKEIDKIINKKLPFIREEVTREEARRRIEDLNEPFKLEILESIKNEPITLYHIGNEWWDLCAGPHVETTGNLSSKAIALQHVAGAYWRGDENREMLQRIYGTAWETPEQLKEHKRRLEEAKKRDHRVLGKKLDLFSIQEDAGGGLVFWHPKGSIIRRLIEEYWTDIHIKGGYKLLYTPHIANVGLWKTSGHFDFYNESMFGQMEVEKEEEYQLKPMNCPFHCLVYKDTVRSYRELPIRYAEMGTVYRFERSGTLHGLMRVRGFTQDDGHIFCLPDQLRDEIIAALNMVEEVLSRFGFTDYKVMLSTRPEKTVGGDEIWPVATDALKGALQAKGWSYDVDEGGGAFYGPKIDVNIRDAIGRYWQCSTIQCDFNLPQRFDLGYVNHEGARSQPVMLHRAIFGSLERFFAILLEDNAGVFPYWLAPVQVRILPVTDEFRDSAEEMAQRMQEMGIRAQVDPKSDRLKKQIRNAEQARIPVMCILGEAELTSGTLSLRRRGATDLGSANVEHLIEVLKAANQGATEPDLMKAIVGTKF